MVTRNRRAYTGYYRRRRLNCVQKESESHATRNHLLIALAALLLALLATAPAMAVPDGCEVTGDTANCVDVPASGIHFSNDDVNEVNVDDGVAGAIEIAPGTPGIVLEETGQFGGDPGAHADFDRMLYDTDDDPETPDLWVVSFDGSPHMVDGDFIYVLDSDEPGLFQVGESGATYSGIELAEFLATTSPDIGASVSGGLTVNNNASYTTTDAAGIDASSKGGRGGNGRCHTVLYLYSWCDNGGRGGDAGSVVINSDGTIVTAGETEGSHGISAISRGGDGGTGGGEFGVFGSDAGAGGDGGNGSTVFVTLGENSSITTHADKSHGVYAKSTGGDGGFGGDPDSLIAIGDKGGDGGDAGNVTVNNQGTILTLGENSHGIYALSAGAGAGEGSDADGAYAVGGNGGGESDGAEVNVNNSGRIETRGGDAYGIFAQSIGGGGGDGGSAGGWFTVGGRGGSGGNSSTASVFDSGTIRTSGDRSTAIVAQSIGGGGGNGGDAVSVTSGLAVAIGGSGGPGGDGDNVYVTTTGSDIDTAGDNSHGIMAQSIGGGGGNGGMALSGSVPGNSSISVAFTLGGSGGKGGSAGDLIEIITDEETTIDTAGDNSHGIMAQSIGGGGGNGGFAGSFAAGAASFGVAIGGSGGDGGAAGQVDIHNFGWIGTSGMNSSGIFAQSIGGGGGNGGSAMAGTAGLLSVSTTVGGGGGSGNKGGALNIFNDGSILTRGANSYGVFAQSVGGGGGAGGSATSIALAGGAAIGVAVGGDGGAGGDGGNVNVTNTGIITTTGSGSDGVFAQSIGGSGGAGGNATTTTLAFPVEIEGFEIPAIALNVAVGGNGGGGGTAGIVDIDNFGSIMTHGFMSNGVFAQSVGGSGGRGGNATNIQVTVDALFSGTVGIGGSGGEGGVGNDVFVDNFGTIWTQGDWSNGVFAQSVGGGGGFGGDATTVALSLTPPPTQPSDLIPGFDMSFDLAIGGDGGDGAKAGNVEVTNESGIMTEGNFSVGIMAQSVGGAGGTGGDARVIQVDLSADPMDLISMLDLTSLDITLVFGGSGGNGGDGGDVTVTNDGDVATQGVFSHGIVAQSVGGGGGSGGSAATFEFSNTDLLPQPEIIDTISGLTTFEMTFQGSGGAGGSGGNVTLNSDGTIITEGDFAMGVVAQSVGGSGGLAGFFNPHGIIDNQVGDALFNAFVDTDVGFSFAGSIGGAGDAGDVTLNHTGDIYTFGVGAHGLFAQSAAGVSYTPGPDDDPELEAVEGEAGTVEVNLDGTVLAFGDHSYGIFAQSGGTGGSGNITINIGDGTVMGGGGSGAGVLIAGGAVNTLTNEGLIMSVPGIQGWAVRSTYGDEFVENFGTMTGSVALGAGANRIENYGMINAGAIYDLGLGNLLLNEGIFAPGGVDNVFASTVYGDFTQTAGGTLWFDVVFDFGTDSWDFLDIDGAADLHGMLRLQLHDTGSVMPGHWQASIISSADGISNFGLDLDAPDSAVINYALKAANENDYVLHYMVDFAPTGLTHNQAALGLHFNDIQLAGSTEKMKPLTAAIVAAPDVPTLGAAYDHLSPHIYAENQLGRLFSALDFEQSLHSCSVRDGDFRFSREGQCTWMRISERDVSFDGRAGLPSATDYATIVNLGFQLAMSRHWHGGIGFGFERSKYEIRDFAQRDGRQMQLGGILKGRYGGNAIDASVTMGQGEYDTRRWVDFSYDGEFTAAARDIRFISAHAGYGYSFEGEKWFARPGVDIGWTDINGDRLDELGGGPTALHMRGTDDEYITSRVDLRLGGELAGSTGMLYRPFLRTAYTHVHSGTRNEITARLDGAPESVPDFTQVVMVDDNYTSVSLGLDILARENWIMSFAYDKQFADRWDADSFFAKIMFEM